MRSERPTDAEVPIATMTTRGRPRKGEELINLPKCWAMRFQKRMTYAQIADHFGCGKSAMARACQKLERFLPDPDQTAAYRDIKGEVLEGIQLQLCASLSDPRKLEKATTNQVGVCVFQGLGATPLGARGKHG
ncbi:MAG TPA: hypothetical protein VKB81_13590 [Nitrospira sp.]|nr:hypothetical protein [Nitrospira sp.]